MRSTSAVGSAVTVAPFCCDYSELLAFCAVGKYRFQAGRRFHWNQSPLAALLGSESPSGQGYIIFNGASPFTTAKIVAVSAQGENVVSTKIRQTRPRGRRRDDDPHAARRHAGGSRPYHRGTGR